MRHETQTERTTQSISRQDVSATIYETALMLTSISLQDIRLCVSILWRSGVSLLEKPILWRGPLLKLHKLAFELDLTIYCPSNALFNLSSGSLKFLVMLETEQRFIGEC